MFTSNVKTENGLNLVIIFEKSSVVFSLEKNTESWMHQFKFDPQTFNDLYQHLECFSRKVWPNLIAKPATSHGTDYEEYYDKELDNNGYLRIEPNTLMIERPSKESLRLYRFNKAKMQSFLFDLDQIIKG
ncbi:hypothetical protein [Paenibacillus massiliensis]|uniref:hypothetical protein n=1 Tax=Paenibacillus massiliensis TaxID=225917 RepID=UPI00048D8FFC|nr:hypothetical protein [Paenibacillus massiliensis]